MKLNTCCRTALFVLVASLYLFSAVASAHELILKPSKMNAEKGTVLPVEVQSTHIFIVKEEVENIDRIKAGVFRNGAAEWARLTPNDAELRIDTTVKIEDSGATLVIAEKDGEPWAATSKGSRAGTRAELEAQGLKVLRVNKYNKYAKAVVNAAKGDDSFATVVGQELEIVPVTNPADAKVGEYFKVKILLRGQPASLPVWATWDGFETERQSTYAFYTESDADGLAWIRVTHPGLWIVRTAKDGLEGVKGEYDALNLRSILTVEIR